MNTARRWYFIATIIKVIIRHVVESTIVTKRKTFSLPSLQDHTLHLKPTAANGDDTTTTLPATSRASCRHDGATATTTTNRGR